MTKITDECLLKHGYKRYNPTSFDDGLVIERYQKRFDDEQGKKYFIDVVKYAHDLIPLDWNDEIWEKFVYHFELHFTMFEEEKVFKIEFYSGWELEEIEQFAEDFFNKMKPNYYERWDEN